MKKVLIAIALLLGFTVSAQRDPGTPQELKSVISALSRVVVAPDCVVAVTVTLPV